MTPKTSLNRIVVGIWICPLLFCFFWFLPNTHRCTCIMPVCSGLCGFCLSRNLICQAPRFIYAFTLKIPELTMNHVTNIVNSVNQMSFVTNWAITLIVLSTRMEMELSNSCIYAFQTGDIGSEIKLRHRMTDAPGNMLLLLNKNINIHFKTLLLLHHLKAKCYEIRFQTSLQCLSWTLKALSC